MRNFLLAVLSMMALGAWAHDFSVDGIYYNITDSTARQVAVTYQGSSYTTAAYSGDVVIPSEVTYNDTAYTVTSIGDYALRSCGGVTSVSIPETVTYIGTTAFGQCTSLTAAVIPGSVTSMGNSVFSKCTALSDVTLGAGLTSTGSTTFSGCTSLAGITIPDNITSVGSYCFQYSGLESISLGDSLASVGTYAFSYCESLADVSISNISDLANYSFYGSTGVKNVKIKGVGDANIGTYCFHSCSGMETLSVEGVDTIGTYAFANCTSLSDITLAEGLETIMTYAFYNDSAFMGVDIPVSVGYIGGYAFRNCSKLAEIAIPGNGETVLDGRVFQGCWGLRKVTFGTGVANIKGGFYSQCDSITDFYSLSATPPSLTITALSTYLFNNSTLHVPQGCAETYASTSVWLKFANIVDDIEEESLVAEVSADSSGPAVYAANGQIVVEGSTGDVEIYTIGGALIYRGRGGAIDARGGVYIVKTAGKVVKVAL